MLLGGSGAVSARECDNKGVQARSQEITTEALRCGLKGFYEPHYGEVGLLTNHIPPKG